MPISVTCPGCDRGLKAPDSSAGRNIKCPKCGGAVPVPDAGEAMDTPPLKKQPVATQVGKSSRLPAGEDDERPRRRGREDDAESPRRGKKKRKGQKTPVGLWIGVGVGALALVIVVVLILVFNSKPAATDAPVKQVAQADKQPKKGLPPIKEEFNVEQIVDQAAPRAEKGTGQEFLQSQRKLKQLALAMQSYHSTHNKFPRAAITGKDGKPLLSWRVAILPNLDQDNLYRQFKLNEPWDSDHNKQLIDKMPALYQPVRTDPGGGKTYYQVFTGKLGPFGEGRQPRLTSFTDGTSNTFLIAEGPKAVIWTKPDDMEYDGGHKFKDGEPITKIGGMFSNAFNAAMADGSASQFERSVSAEQIHAMITANGGENTPLPK